MRLTGIRMMVAQEPLGAPNEIDLSPFEGKEVTVSGNFSGDIVYNAAVSENQTGDRY